MKPRDTLLAAIPFAKDEAVDLLLEYVARVLVKRGFRVAGFIQHSGHLQGRCCGAVDVEDITTGRCYQIMQPLGAHARGCRLDPQVMAIVAARALGILDEQPDILILNRFGKGESEGAGLRSVFEAASIAGVPILTSVKETYFPAWHDFADDMASNLAPDDGKVLRWCMNAIDRAREQRDTQGMKHGRSAVFA